MPLKTDYILVIDIEATCWPGDPPPGQFREIIEIGIATLDLTSRQRGQRERILVRPVASKVSDYCTELTGLTQSQVEKGVSFSTACDRLRRRFRSHERLWASFGDFDRRAFDSQCRHFEVKYPFSNQHLNIKSLYSALHLPNRDPGLTEVLANLGLPFEGTHHRADDDAWNAAAALGALLCPIALSTPHA